MTRPPDHAEKPWSSYTAAAFVARNKPKGFWRRNIWAFIAVLPLLAGVVALRWDDIYWQYWRADSRVPLAAAQQQWVGFLGAEMRLVEFAQVTDFAAAGGKAVELPGGIKAWRAVIEFKAPDQESVAGCQIRLEDSAARLYSSSPTELSRARLPSGSCDAPFDAPSTDYRSTVFFATPGDAAPVAVRVSRATELPYFARLSIGP